MKRKIFLLRKLVAVLLLGVTVAGCASTRHGIEINNVPNIREIYIRNSGTTNWGTNIASIMQDIDKSRFSEMVDIRVLDTNGIVYSRYNVPFNDAAFVETNKASQPNMYVMGLLGIAMIAVAYSLYSPSPKGE